MKSRNLIIGALLILFALSATFIYSTWGLTVTIDTNGTDVEIKSSSLLPLPAGMMSEMKQKALEDVQDPYSSVDSIKGDISSIARKYNYTANVKVVSQFGENQLAMPATVKGTSMVPTLKDGQSIVLLKTKDLKTGDIVVAIHPQYDLIVKRLTKIENGQVYLMSDNRQIEIIGTTRRINNGRVETVTLEKVPLDTWLPQENVIGVVKIY